MATFKLTISDKSGKSITRELKEKDANPILGLKIGTDVDAAIVGQAGKMKITGGSDKSGVPMRADVQGGARKYVMLSKGVGLRAAELGQRFRKLIRGNVITEDLYQINCVLDGQLKVESVQAESEEKKEKTEKPKKA